MKIIPVLTFLVSAVADIWLLLIIRRQNVRKNLPWFALYVLTEFVTTCIGLALWLIDKRLYVNVFWWLEALRIVLIVGAMRESFVRTFVGFSSLRWFPWAVRGVIGAVLLYSIWKAVYAPPAQNSLSISLIVTGEFTFRWGITAIGLMSLFLVWLFDLPNDTRETTVMDGFGIASAAFLANVVSRSLFGERYTSVMQFVPDIGYLVAVALWIKFMRYPEQEFGFEQLGITPEMMALELRRYREGAEQILTKGQRKRTPLEK